MYIPYSIAATFCKITPAGGRQARAKLKNEIFLKRLWKKYKKCSCVDTCTVIGQLKVKDYDGVHKVSRFFIHTAVGPILGLVLFKP